MECSVKVMQLWNCKISNFIGLTMILGAKATWLLV